MSIISATMQIDNRTKKLLLLITTVGCMCTLYLQLAEEMFVSNLRGQSLPVMSERRALAILDSNTERQRRLSIINPDGTCKWEAPEYDIPDSIPFYKTLIAGFPSCDKRMTFTQMEGLTGWAARDEWDFIYGVPRETNHPFIKSNYPHHEGYWSWGSKADQVVMVVRNMRRTMVEYHDILFDIKTAQNSGLSYLDVLYRYRPPMGAFLKWRDSRVMDEIKWYGWFIDYWMEGGLRRDVFSNRLTSAAAWPYFPEEAETPECSTNYWHASKYDANTCTNSMDYNTPPPTSNPTNYPTQSPTTAAPTTAAPTHAPTPNNTLISNYTSHPTQQVIPAPLPPQLPPPQVASPIPYLFGSRASCCQALFPGNCFVADTCPTPAPTPAIQANYDSHCSNGEITHGCIPAAVISAEKLRSTTDGFLETQRIGNVLSNRAGISEYLIDSTAWQCIWEELIVNGRGNRMVKDRELSTDGILYTENDYNFSEEMLVEMINELNRLISKYTGSSWSGSSNAKIKENSLRVTGLLSEHLSYIQAEKNEVASGSRMLTDRDFLGPRERERRRRLSAIEEGRDPDDDAESIDEEKKSFEYFMKLEEHYKSNRRLNKSRESEQERLESIRRRATKA